MKRRDLEKHLQQHGCFPARDRGPHEIWLNEASGRIAPVPRHREIKPYTANSICDKLGVPRLDKK
ncbi:MAG: type II toxin-antitoxin system HicA family toxin [Phycisphaeraceae bacterium]